MIDEEDPHRVQKLFNNQQIKINQFLKKQDKIFRLDFLKHPQQLPVEKDRITFIFSHSTRNEEEFFSTPFHLTFNKNDTIDKIFALIASLLDGKEVTYKDKVYQIKMENLKITAYTDARMTEKSFMVDTTNNMHIYLITEKDVDINTVYYCSIQHTHITTKEQAITLKIN
jgi:hypothetical protein